ncbi:MAG: VOC family protein [Acidimicrobiales bacterium]
MRLHHVNLVCGPGLVEPTAAFWRDVFGLTDLERHGRSGRPGAWLDAGSFEVHLSERDEPQSPDAHIAVSVDDVASVRERCLAVGAPWEDADALFGVGRGFTRDPAGNRVEVVNESS